MINLRLKVGIEKVKPLESIQCGAMNVTISIDILLGFI